MSKTKKSHVGQGFWQKVVSWLIIMAMMIGLVPADFTLVTKAAEATKPKIRIYFENTNNWETPVINVWDTGATVSAGSMTDVFGWSQGNGGEPWQQRPALIKESGTNFYFADVTSDNWIGLQILDGPSTVWEDGATEKKNTIKLDGSNAADSKILAAISALPTNSSVYYLSSKNGWYKDREGNVPLQAEAKTVTLHFLDTYDWTTPVIDAWKSEFVSISGNSGKETVTAWNKQFPKLSYESTEEGYDWYSVKVTYTGAVAGMQFVDAETAEVKYFDTEKLAVVNNAAANADIYYGVNEKGKDIVTTDKTQIVIPSEAPIERTSPEYKEDGKVVFNLATASTVASATLQGTFTSWKVNEITMEKVEDPESGFVGFTAEVAVPTRGGLYRYDMYTGLNNYVGDPLNGTKVNGKSVVVRNPEIGNGTATIYYPCQGALNSESKVLYRKAGSYDTYKEQTLKKVEEADNLYAAVITDVEATQEYEYKIQIGNEEAKNDAYNFASKKADGTTTFTVPRKMEEPAYESPVINEDGTVTFNYWAPVAEEVKIAGSMFGDSDWFETAKTMTKNEKQTKYKINLIHFFLFFKV